MEKCGAPGESSTEAGWCHCKMGPVLVQVDLLAVVLCQPCWPRQLLQSCFGACPTCCPAAAWWHQLESAWIQLHPAQTPSWTPEHGRVMQNLLELSPEGANSQLDPNQLCNWIRTSTASALQPLYVWCQGPGADMLTPLRIEAVGSKRTSARALCHVKAALGFIDPSWFWKRCRCPIS